MIPPLTSSRRRAIERWLEEGSRAPNDPQALRQRVERLDALMLDEFDARTSQVQEAMMRRGHWGTEEATNEYHMAELGIWGEIFETFLPVREGLAD